MNYWYIMTTRKSTEKILFLAVIAVHSEHRINVLNVKSIGKEHLNVFITKQFIEKTVSFWDSVKKFRRSHQKWSIKLFLKLLLKILQYSQENTYVGVSFNKVESLQTTLLKENPTQVFPCEYCKIFKNTSWRLLLKVF